MTKIDYGRHFLFLYIFWKFYEVKMTPKLFFIPKSFFIFKIIFEGQVT